MKAIQCYDGDGVASRFLPDDERTKLLRSILASPIWRQHRHRDQNEPDPDIANIVDAHQELVTASKDGFSPSTMPRTLRTAARTLRRFAKHQPAYRSVLTQVLSDDLRRLAFMLEGI